LRIARGVIIGWFSTTILGNIMAGIVSSRILEKACDWSNEKYDECKIALVV